MHPSGSTGRACSVAISRNGPPNVSNVETTIRYITGLRKHERDPRVAPARAVVVLEPGVEPRTLHHQYASNASETNIDREGLPRVSLDRPRPWGGDATRAARPRSVGAKGHRISSR